MRGVPAARNAMFLLAATSPALTPASAGVSLLVAALAAFFALLALRAAGRRGNPSLRWVGGAFLLFGLKNGFSSYNVWTHLVPHDAIELVLSVADLAIMLLLFAPLLLRRKA